MDPQTSDRPRLKAHLVAHVVVPDKVFLVSEQGNYLVRGEAAVAIAPYLDGQHSMAEIVDAVGDRVSFTDCVFALSKFRRFGHVTGGLDTDPGRPATAMWDAWGVGPGVADRRLRAATVSLATLGATDMQASAAVALADNGVSVRATSWDRIPETDATLAVVLTEDYLDERLARIDAGMRAAQRPWLLAKPIGLEIWLGPVFRSDRTGCWLCLHERLDGNRAIGQYLRHVNRHQTPPRASVAGLPFSLGLAGNLVAGAVVAALVADDRPADVAETSLDGVLTTLHAIDLTSERHELVRQPQCPACGDPTLVQRDPRVVIERRPVAVLDDGGHRVMAPQDTYDRLAGHVDRLLGAVTSLRPLAGPSDGLTFSYAAGHNFAVQPHVEGLRRTLRGQSGGKGRTEIQAKVSAVCEAIERYCGVWRDGYPTTVASFAELGPRRAVAVEDLLQFSPTQYATRAAWNRTSAGRLHRVPDELGADQRISWTSAWSLTDERVRLLPAAYTWFGHPDLYQHAFCYPDANGNAAGNTVEEAVLQGFCELVERDSVALWWYNRLRRPGFDLDSLADPYVDRLRESYARQGREIWALDLTADLGVPAFAAVSRRTDHPVEDVLLGFGAHLDARLAISRALTELNQFLPAVTARNADGSTDYWEDDPATLSWWRSTLVADQPWLLPDPDAKCSTLGSYPRCPGGDLADEVRACVELARTAGLEVIVCDQSRPDIELKVVKVAVPGLRHFWRRLAPGRLYDVPVAQGWLDRPTAEADCNPISVYF